MRHLFSFCVLTALFGLNCGQNSLEFGDNYDYELGSHQMIDDNEGPKKIGELEFDVEVAEETPKPGENIPEVVVENKDYLEDRDGSQVWNPLSVELTNKSERVGDIMFQIEVADKQKTNTSVEGPQANQNRQAFPSDIMKSPTNLENQINPDSSAIATIEEEDTSATLALEATSSQESEETEETASSATLSTDTPMGQNGETQAPFQESTFAPTFAQTFAPTFVSTSALTSVPTSSPTNPTTSPGSGESKGDNMWPIYVIAVIFFILTFTGIVWALLRLHMVSKAEEDLERQVAEAPVLRVKESDARNPTPVPELEARGAPKAPAGKSSSEDLSSVRSGLGSTTGSNSGAGAAK